MKTGFLVVAMTIGLLAATMTGNVLAAEWNENGADPEGAFIQEWVGHGAIETGALPDGSGNIASGNEKFPVVEIGSVRYRVGLDTGP